MSSKSSPTTSSGDSRPARRSGASGADDGWSVVGTLLSGIVVWGGIGWLLDLWLDTRAFTPIGVLLGVGLSIYLVVKKFGGEPPAPLAGKVERSLKTSQPDAPRTTSPDSPAAPQHDAPGKDL